MQFCRADNQSVFFPHNNPQSVEIATANARKLPRGQVRMTDGCSIIGKGFTLFIHQRETETFKAEKILAHQQTTVRPSWQESSRERGHLIKRGQWLITST